MSIPIVEISCQRYFLILWSKKFEAHLLWFCFRSIKQVYSHDKSPLQFLIRFSKGQWTFFIADEEGLLRKLSSEVPFGKAERKNSRKTLDSLRGSNKRPQIQPSLSFLHEHPICFIGNKIRKITKTSLTSAPISPPIFLTSWLQKCNLRPFPSILFSSKMLLYFFF